MSLTLVYSTRQPNAAFSHHLRQTCGVKEIEILAYTNPGQQSLSKIYNQGLMAARYPIIVFLHDDIILESRHWGRKLLKHFQSSKFGILGIAGTTELPASGQWWQNPLTRIGMIKHQQHHQIWTTQYSGNFHHRIIPAVCVDGVFIAVHKERLQEDFNEQLTGFHFYDVDFCLNNHLAGVNIGVIFNIKLIHKSMGLPTPDWEQSRLRFLSYHQYNLPCAIQGEVIIEEKTLQLMSFPKVSVIILHQSKNALLFNCLNSFTEKCRYPNYEIIVADTGSTKSELEEIYQLIHTTSLKMKVIEFNHYHFGRINNAAVAATSNDLILFCNNDIELLNDALSRMIQVYLNHPNHCGTIGCRLHFADNTIQHAGIQLVMTDNHLEIGHHGFHSYYHFPTDAAETEVLGSTAAFLLMERSLFEQVGGFNTAYSECLEDVELNLTCLQRKRINYFVSDAVCYHFESQTRQRTGIIRQDYERLLNFFEKHPEIMEKYIL